MTGERVWISLEYGLSNLNNIGGKTPRQLKTSDEPDQRRMGGCARYDNIWPFQTGVSPHDLSQN